MSRIADFSRIDQPGIPERNAAPVSAHNLQFKQVIGEASDQQKFRILASQLLHQLDRSSMHALFSDTATLPANTLSTDLFLNLRTPPKSEPVISQGAENLATASGSSLDSIIEQAAATFGLDRNLIEAVIRTESDFNPEAVSAAGAQGLMQLMPETASDLGVENPFDPAQNIHAGSRYLKQLLDRYDGDLNSALAAYNWGMGNLERHPEKMPAETINYIAKINALLSQNA